jgi:hypothetical protein
LKQRGSISGTIHRPDNRPQLMRLSLGSNDPLPP